MTHHLYTLLCLLIESLAARRDAQIRFLKEENRILRSRIHSQRLILSPQERCRLTAALLDRLTHRCHIFEMNGPSYRFKESTQKPRAKAKAKSQ